MKKLLASAAAAAVLTAGLSAGHASAAPRPAYPPTIKTKVIVKTPADQKGKPYRVNQKARLFVDVKAVGTAKPRRGLITLKFQAKVKVKGKYKWRTVTRAEKFRPTSKRAYYGKTTTMNIGWFRKAGKYRAIATFTPRGNTVFKASTHIMNIRVK